MLINRWDTTLDLMTCLLQTKTKPDTNDISLCVFEHLGTFVKGMAQFISST